jgi:UDP-N-acetylglucosamine acyltransferase
VSRHALSKPTSRARSLRLDRVEHDELPAIQAALQNHEIKPIPTEDPADLAIQIHPTAIVDHSAHLEPGVKIGAYAVVGPRCVVGRATVIQHHAIVEQDTTLGQGNQVFPFAVVGSEPQDLKHKGERTTLVIGDHNQIREHATIHRGTAVGGGITRVGSRCLVMVGAHVAHDCILDDEVILANQVMLGGHAHIATGATVAGGAGIHHFATVGKYAFVGGLARIAKDVPPFLVVEGSPAEPRKVNTVALSRRGFAEADIEALKNAFKTLFRDHDAPMSVLVRRLLDDPKQPACVRELCDSLDRVRLGVHGRWRESLRDTHAAPRR